MCNYLSLTEEITIQSPSCKNEVRGHGARTGFELVSFLQPYFPSSEITFPLFSSPSWIGCHSSAHQRLTSLHLGAVFLVLSAPHRPVQSSATEAYMSLPNLRNRYFREHSYLCVHMWLWRAMTSWATHSWRRPHLGREKMQTEDPREFAFA